MAIFPVHRRRWPTIFVSFFLAVLIIWRFGHRQPHYLSQEGGEDASTLTLAPDLFEFDTNQPPCLGLPGGEDVLVILKTGATEVRRKLSVHFTTTLRCIPHYVIYSDLEEELEGHVIQDALADVSDEIKKTKSEFSLYNNLREFRNQGKDIEELISGNQKLAWDLDKWKFLSMIPKALKERPEAKWFVFIEADTYLVWSNLLQWLAKLNHNRPYYLGCQAWLEMQTFGHGGSGYIISQVAMGLLAQELEKNANEYNTLTSFEVAGDVVLAKAFERIGIKLTPSYPTLQSATPYSLEYTNQNWCGPVVSYHHMPPAWIDLMWNFEQNWIHHNKQKKSSPILHRDVFSQFVDPLIHVQRMGWDNFSRDNKEKSDGTLQGCIDACISRRDCIQYLHTGEDCTTTNAIRLGAKQGPIEKYINHTSGWLPDRVERFKKSMGVCKPVWIRS